MRVVPKVPLHSLFCHNNRESELTTLMVIKYYILGLWGYIFTLLRAFVKTQWKFEPLYPYSSRAGIMMLSLIVNFFYDILPFETIKKSISKIDMYFLFIFFFFKFSFTSLLRLFQLI